MLSLKIVAVGDCNIGKRCLLRSYAERKFPNDDIKNTSNGYAADMNICGKHIQLKLWDINCEAEYARMRPLTYALTDAFLLCFSVADSGSFHNVEKMWYPEIVHHCPNVPFILVGTKCDVIKDKTTDKVHRVQRADAHAFAKRINAVKYLECSSLTRQGLDDVFLEAVHAVLSVPPDKDKDDNTSKQRTNSCVVA